MTATSEALAASAKRRALQCATPMYERDSACRGLRRAARYQCASASTPRPSTWSTFWPQRRHLPRRSMSERLLSGMVVARLAGRCPGLALAVAVPPLSEEAATRRVDCRRVVRAMRLRYAAANARRAPSRRSRRTYDRRPSGSLSEAIRGQQRSSEVIRGHQRSLEVISGL